MKLETDAEIIAIIGGASGIVGYLLNILYKLLRAFFVTRREHKELSKKVDNIDKNIIKIVTRLDDIANDQNKNDDRIFKLARGQ